MRTSSAVACGEVTTLGHEAGDDTMEGRALEVEGNALTAHALLAGAERLEVLGRLGHDIVVESELDAPGLNSSMRVSSCTAAEQRIEDIGGRSAAQVATRSPLTSLHDTHRSTSDRDIKEDLGASGRHAEGERLGGRAEGCGDD